MPQLRLLIPPAVLLSCALIFAGCSSSSPPQAHPTTPSPAVTTPPPTPPPLPKCKLPKKLDFPSWVPKDLPLPDGVYASQRLATEAGYFRGLFVLPVNTTDFAKFVLSKWPKAGWQLGRGDAEPGEVEDQFLRSPAFGAFKAQDMVCRSPHAIMLLIYVPDRGKLPGVGTQPSSPLPGKTSPSPGSSPLSPTPSPSPS